MNNFLSNWFLTFYLVAYLEDEMNYYYDSVMFWNLQDEN